MKAIILLNQVKRILMDMFMLRILKLEIIKLFWRYKNVRSNCYSFHFRRKRNKTEINICHCDADLKSEDLKCLFTVATDDTLKKFVESFNKYYKKIRDKYLYKNVSFSSSN